MRSKLFDQSILTIHDHDLFLGLCGSVHLFSMSSTLGSVSSTQIIYSCVFCFMAAFSSLSSRSGVENWFEKTRRNLGQPGEKWELARLEVSQERRAAVVQTWDRGRSTFWNDHHHCNHHHHHCNHHRCQQCRKQPVHIKTLQQNLMVNVICSK